jgi:hypothetical protein
MNIPLEAPCDQSDWLRARRDADADAAQRDLFEYFAPPLTEAHAPPIAADAPPAIAADAPPAAPPEAVATEKDEDAAWHDQILAWYGSTQDDEISDHEPESLDEIAACDSDGCAADAEGAAPPDDEISDHEPASLDEIAACDLIACAAHAEVALLERRRKECSRSSGTSKRPRRRSGPVWKPRFDRSPNCLRPKLLLLAPAVPAPAAQPEMPQVEVPRVEALGAETPRGETAKAEVVTGPPATAVAEDEAPSPPVPAARAAKSQDVRLLLDQGKQFFDVGDLIAARILFLRAANAGDAAAAVAMGATYDPVVLADRGVRGVAADLDKARSWYERAREMGSPEGPRRLEMLANR